MHHQEMGQLQVHLKGLLNRDQTSADIVTEDLAENALKESSAGLLCLVKQNNPQTQRDAKEIEKQDAAVASAKREGNLRFRPPQ
jgi:outer membrane protein, heavy metal efflux system